MISNDKIVDYPFYLSLEDRQGFSWGTIDLTGIPKSITCFSLARQIAKKHSEKKSKKKIKIFFEKLLKFFFRNYFGKDNF